VKTVIRHSHFVFVLRKLVFPIPKRTLQGTLFVIVAILITTTPVLAIVKPAKVTNTYEVLEPWTWVGKELPLFDHIDIADQLKGGNWLAVLYHYDCPDCKTIIPKYTKMAGNLKDSMDYLNIALIEAPPYKADPPQQDAPWISGKMDESKEWFVLTPAPMLIVDGRIRRVYDRKIPPNIVRVFGDLLDMNDIFDTCSSQTKHSGKQ
jgi:thiol-disulfide isomerase/thioredoxin